LLSFWAGRVNVIIQLVTVTLPVYQLTGYNLIIPVRYFTGNTKNPDGSVQFIKGETTVSKAVDGVIKILTIAVSEVPGFILYLCIM
jgi:hypothetical protein